MSESQNLRRYNMGLKLAILASGKTQRAIARATDIDETRLSRLVGGTVQPFPAEREALALELRRSEAELFPPAMASADLAASA